jgi:hypothetical protein
MPLMVIFHEAWTINKVHVFGLTPADYENLSVNVAAAHKALVQRRSQILYYKNCINKFNEM